MKSLCFYNIGYFYICLVQNRDKTFVFEVFTVYSVPTYFILNMSLSEHNITIY